MYTQEEIKEINNDLIETLDTYILRENEYHISNKARFSAFKHRTKVEFLRFFIV